MLTNVEAVRNLPGLGNLASVPIAWLNDLIGAADAAIKRHCKRDLELTNYVEFYSGNGLPELPLNQYPVLFAQTTVAAGSNGAVLPQSTINVTSTANFPPGTFGNPNAVPPAIALQTGASSWTFVTYTGVTATSFTGCSGGSGTLSSSSGPPALNGVASPVVFFDPSAYGGQAPNAFANSSPTSTQMILGNQFMVVPDKGGKVSNRGILRRIAGAGAGFVGFYPEVLFSGKLGGYKLPAWSRGDGNIKCMYSAGYRMVPFDLQYAAGMLVAYMVRNMPVGAILSSESLGAYSYSIIQQSKDIPELGSLLTTLSYYREYSI